MALVDDDKVKEIMRELRIVRKRYFFALVVIFIVLTIHNIFSFQEREQSLNSRYDHIAVRGEPGRFQPVNLIYIIESLSIFSQPESPKFILGLFPKIIAVNKE